jgi:hypothetical protein
MVSRWLYWLQGVCSDQSLACPMFCTSEFAMDNPIASRLSEAMYRTVYRLSGPSRLNLFAGTIREQSGEETIPNDPKRF